MNFLRKLILSFTQETTQNIATSKHTSEYFSAREGSFNKNDFIIEGTNKFKFPKYNQDNSKYLVKVKDNTNYKEYYFDGYSKEEKDNFTFDDFEKIFISPELEIESFEDFIERLNSNYFEKAIGKKQTLFLFEEFEDFLNDKEANDGSLILDRKNSNKLEELNYIIKADEQFNQTEYISTLSHNELENLCKQNSIKPFKTKKALTNQVLGLKLDLDIPFILVNPTEKLKKYFSSFIELYISELKKSADRFHPLYIESIFQEALYANDNKYVNNLIKDIIESGFWKTDIETKSF